VQWKVADAKQRFSEVVRLAAKEPQLIYNRGRLVAAVVDADTLQAFASWRQSQRQISLAEAFMELRHLAAEEHYEFEISARRDRPNAFADAIDELSR
jgi:prevent-host-death family protein